MDLKSCIQRLTDALTPHDEVLLAYLFGSVAQGRARRDSDLDVAVYLDESHSYEQVQSLWDAVEDAVGRDVHLTVMNEANPSVAWEAMKGVKLLVRDERVELAAMLEFSLEAEEFREWTQSYWEELRRVREAQRG